jgi:serine/threonine protein kinase, bacterial
VSADAPDTEAVETAEGELAPLAYAEADHGDGDGVPRRGGRLRWAIAAALLCVSLTAVLVLAGVLLHRTTRTQPSAAPTAAAAIVAPAQPLGQVSAHVAAERVKAALPGGVTLAALTGDNDANHLLGRPKGYAAATVIVDPRSNGWCDPGQPGVDCGATVEQWPDAAAAQRRADYIQTIQGAAAMLGTEYDTVRGNLLLRVSGKLAPAVADQYRSAFMAA